MIPYDQLKKMVADKWRGRAMTQEQALTTALQLQDELDAKEAEFEASKEAVEKLPNTSDLLAKWREPFQKSSDLQQMFIRYLLRKKPQLDGLLGEYLAAWAEECQAISEAHRLVDDDGLPPIDMQYEERARQALPELDAKNNECIAFFFKNQKYITDDKFRDFVSEWVPQFMEAGETTDILWKQYTRAMETEQATHAKVGALLDDVSFRRWELVHFAHLHGMDRAEVEKRAKQRKGPAV